VVHVLRLRKDILVVGMVGNGSYGRKVTLLWRRCVLRWAENELRRSGHVLLPGSLRRNVAVCVVQDVAEREDSVLRLPITVSSGMRSTADRSAAPAWTRVAICMVAQVLLISWSRSVGIH
jgi:hypothetical protein